MGPDFNNDGRVDGYDMEYLGGSGSSRGNAGCGDILKVGCLIPIAIICILTCFFCACSAFTAA